MAPKASSPSSERSSSEAEAPAQTDADALRIPGQVDAKRHVTANPLADLRKPVEAILITPHKRKLTLLSRRFFNVMLRHAQQHPVPAGDYHEISLAQFIQDARYPSRNMEHLAEVLECLTSTSVTWGDSPKNLKGPKYERTSASLVSLARIRKLEGQSPTLLYDFQKEVRELLLNPRVYASIALSMNAKMKTQPALVLYELGIRYLTNKNGLTMRMQWRDWVAPLTGNPDVGEDLEYKYFARDVLKPALREVNDAQDEFELVALPGKVSRRVETLQFQVVRKGGGTPQSAPAVLAGIDTESLGLIGRMLNLRISQDAAEKLVVKYGSERTRQALDVVEAAGDKVRAPLPYLRTVLEKGDFPNAPLDIDFKPVPNTRLEEGLLQRWKKAYLEHVRNDALKVYMEGGTDLQKEFLNRFEQERLVTLNAPIQRAWKEFRAQWPHKVMSAFVAVPFKEWLAAAYASPTEDEVVDWASRAGLLQTTAEEA